MLTAVKRLVGADRAKAHQVPTLDRAELERPVTKARERLEAAQAEHSEAGTRLASITAEIEKAQAAFDADGSDSNADRLMDLGRDRDRARLFRERTQRAVVTAESDVAQAEKARNDAIAEHCRTRVEGAGDRLVALWKAKGRPALEAFVAFIHDADALIDDARVAAQELERVAPDDSPLFAKIRGIDALRGVLRASIAQDVGAPDRLKLERLVTP